MEQRVWVNRVLTGRMHPHHLSGQAGEQPGLTHKALVQTGRQLAVGLPAQKLAVGGRDPQALTYSWAGLACVFQEAERILPWGPLSRAINFLIEAQISKHIIHCIWTP